MSPPLWMVRASGRAARSGAFRVDGVVGIRVGRAFRGIPQYDEPHQLLEEFQRLRPQWRRGRHRAAASQLHCFLEEMRIGDRVMTWDPARRRFYLGTVDSDARWDPDGLDELPFLRAVQWSHELHPGDLSAECRAALNVIQTLFHVGPRIAAEVEEAAQPMGVRPLDDATPAPDQAPQDRPSAPADAAQPEQQWTPPISDDLARLDVEHTPTPGSLHRITPPTQVTVQGLEELLEEGEAPAHAAEDASDQGSEAADQADLSSPDTRPAPRPKPSTAVQTPSPGARPMVDLPRVVVEGSSVDPDSHATGLARAARQRVEDRLAGLPIDAQRAVLSGVLQARGYPRRMVDPETGADLYTGADLLGREGEQVRVHAFHPTDRASGADEVRAILDGRTADERWILLATDGFDRGARRLLEEADFDGPRASLLDAGDLARLVLRHYDDFDAASRALVPLQRVWWPAWEEAP